MIAALVWCSVGACWMFVDKLARLQIVCVKRILPPEGNAFAMNFNSESAYSLRSSHIFGALERDLLLKTIWMDDHKKIWPFWSFVIAKVYAIKNREKMRVRNSTISHSCQRRCSGSIRNTRRGHCQWVNNWSWDFWDFDRLYKASETYFGLRRTLTRAVYPEGSVEAPTLFCYKSVLKKCSYQIWYTTRECDVNIRFAGTTQRQLHSVTNTMYTFECQSCKRLCVHRR